MKIIKSKTLVLAFTFISFFSGHNAIAASLEGLSIGVGYNFSAFMGTGKETKTGSGGDSTVVDTTEETGAFQDEVASIFVEYDLGPLSLGLEYVADDMTTPSNTNVQDNNNGDGTTNTVKATFKDHTTLYANIDMPFNTFLKLGYQQVDIATQENLGTGNSYNDADTDGYTLGLGYNHIVDSGVFFRAELSAHAYDDISASGTVDSSKKVDVTDMYGASASIKIGKTF